MAEKEAIEEAHGKLRSKFLEVLLGEREDLDVPVMVRPADPEVDPLDQNSPQTKEEIEIMESCPKADIENLEELLEEENFYLNFLESDYTLQGRTGRLPILILKLKESDEQRKRPAVVFLHSMHKHKESMRPLLKAYASRGYIAISVDSCYHGECASTKDAFRNALVSSCSWHVGRRKAFIYDTVFHLIKLADYLAERQDIDPSRIGLTGISLGGLHAWFTAFADTRYAVVVPLIGVRGFRWAIDNDQWKGQVDSMKHLFEVVRHYIGKDFIDKEVVEKAWDEIAPGLLSEFDSPYSIPAIAPRPLLIINGAEDPQCPLAGLEVPIAKASQTYKEFQCSDNFKFVAEPGVGNQLTRFQVKESSDWFDRFLNP